MKKTLAYILLAGAALLSAACQPKGESEPVKPTPKVLSLLPKAGYPGTEAVIAGYGFEDPGTVSVDGQLCAAGSFSFALTEA